MKQTVPAAAPSSASDAEFCRLTAEEVLQKKETSLQGLSEKEAETRLERFGYNEPAKPKRRTVLIQLFSKFLNPLVIVLLVIAGVSYFFGDTVSAMLVMAMACLSVFLSFFQEFRAGREAAKLSEMVRATATVLRAGQTLEIKIRELVPGDLVVLAAGDMMPADVRVLAAKDLFINQSALTGESFPIEKISDPVQPKNNSLSEMSNIAFMGSSVVSGSGQAVVLKTGLATHFGEISGRLTGRKPVTSFEIGVRNFTFLMIRVMLVLVVVIFAINALLRGNLLEAFLFSLGVAVGLTPEMLPMLVAINLSKGAIAMSKKKVIVKHLNSIQNFGAMDVLCTDKTGTLTLDKVVLEKYCDVVRTTDEDVLRYAHINSYYQTGLRNILDRAILDHENVKLPGLKKVDEIPFDFQRRIMSVVVDINGRRVLIAKGAPEEIFKRCTHYDLEGETLEMEDLILSDLRTEYDTLSAEGFRVLAIAYKETDPAKNIFTKEDEQNLILKGYVAFLDPAKPTVREALVALRNLAIACKVLTGDHELVTRKICKDVGLDVQNLVTGPQLEKFSDVELRERVKTTTVFARLDPLQKERIVKALRSDGHTVGFLGDGINDAPALKAADVGISVNNAVDIAKESADLILLEKSLIVLEDGVLEGRRTFSNIIKYIQMGASSNFGNMFSMTGGSFFLPFLPMLPIQILLNNFLYDLSQTGIPTDNVDPELIQKPRPWDVQRIKRFMLLIGPTSSIFDFTTFGVLLFLFHADATLFHTGWFIESIVTQTLVIHVIRTVKIPFLESWPSWFLIFTSLVITAAGIWIPFSPLGRYFGFVQPPPAYWSMLGIILFAYLFLVQVVKMWFVKKYL